MNAGGFSLRYIPEIQVYLTDADVSYFYQEDSVTGRLNVSGNRTTLCVLVGYRVGISKKCRGIYTRIDRRSEGEVRTRGRIGSDCRDWMVRQRHCMGHV